MTVLNRRTLFVVAGGLSLAPLTAQAQLRSVVDTLAADGRFNRFLELIGRAGMTDGLRGPGPFTLFAPTDGAFTGSPAAAVEDLVSQGSGGGGGGTLSGESPDRLRLQAFIQYFIVPGQAWTLAQLTGPADRTLKTENGAVVVVSSKPGEVVTLRNPAPGQQSGSFGASGFNVMPPATLVQADIAASNGIVHALGGVLFP